MSCFVTSLMVWDIPAYITSHIKGEMSGCHILLQVYRNLISILKRREESNTYLFHVCRHRRSRQVMMKIADSTSTADESHSAGWKLQFHQFSLWSVCSGDVYRHDTGRCRSLPFFLIYFYYFTFPGFHFILIILRVTSSSICASLFSRKDDSFYQLRFLGILIIQSS